VIPVAASALCKRRPAAIAKRISRRPAGGLAAPEKSPVRILLIISVILFAALTLYTNVFRN